jgi:hypothetical protein
MSVVLYIGPSGVPLDRHKQRLTELQQQASICGFTRQQQQQQQQQPAARVEVAALAAATVLFAAAAVLQQHNYC